MGYTKQTWVDEIIDTDGNVITPSTTAMDAARLGHIEDGIFDAHTRIASLVHNVKDHGAIGNGIADDTAAIQATIDAAAITRGTVFLPAGNYLFTELTAKPYVRLLGDGMDSTILQVSAFSTADAAISHEPGPLVYWAMENLTVRGAGITGQHGMMMHAQLPAPPAYQHGGWWYGVVRNVLVHNFLGHTIWLRGGGSGFTPVQAIVFDNVYAFAGSAGTGCALACTGQVGQLTTILGSFEGPGQSGASGTYPNVFIGREAVDETFAVASDGAPYALTFIGPTVQSNKLAMRIERAYAVRLIAPYFENVDQSIDIADSARAIGIEGGIFNNAAGALTGGTGFGVRCANSVASVRDSVFSGNVDQHLIGSGNGGLSSTGISVATPNAITSGMTKQITVEPGGILTLGSLPTVLVNTSATNIVTLNGNHTPGELVHIKAFGGSIVFATGGNITVGTSPMTLGSGLVATFVRMDLSATWQLVSVSP